MWVPTHVQVTVQRAVDLITKGKNNTNDCFVTIALTKTKYQTSVKEKADKNVEWHEECELPIPEQGNTAEVILTVLHRSFIGVDEFLGRVAIPLNSLDIYERPKNKWYPLQSKPGHEGKNKERGRLEVKIGFTVKSGSLSDLTKKDKHKSSIGQLSHVAHSVGGSLLSLGSSEKRKGIKKFTKSIGSKMHLKGKRKDSEGDDNSSFGSIGSLQKLNSFDKYRSRQTREDADPGVVSENEDEFTFDDLSHKSSASSLSQNATNLAANLAITSGDNLTAVDFPVKIATPPAKPPRAETKQDEWESKLFGKQSKNLKPSSNESLDRRSWDSSKLASQIEEETVDVKGSRDNVTNKCTPEPIKREEKEGMFSKFKNFRKDMKTDKTSSERVIIGGENETTVVPTYCSHISSELLQKFEGKTREDLILTVCDLQQDLDSQKKKLKDLEDYLDELLLRVMETTPRILQNPYVTYKLTHKKLTNNKLG